MCAGTAVVSAWCGTGLHHSAGAPGSQTWLLPRSSVDAVDGLSANSILGLLLNDNFSVAESQIGLATSTLAARGGRWAGEIAAVLSYYASFEKLFVDHVDVIHAATSDVLDQQSVELVEAIKTLRSNLPMSPELVAEKLAALSRDLPLAVATS